MLCQMSDKKSELASLLEEEQSSKNRNRMVEYVGTSETRMAELMAYFLDENLHWRYNQRAAWPLAVISDKHPQLVQAHLDALVDRLGKEGHDAVNRNISRILQDIDIPEHLEGIVYDKCYALFNNPDQAIAIRVFSMTVLFRIAKKYPEMFPELEESIRLHLPYGSAGFKNRAGKILNYIDKLRDM